MSDYYAAVYGAGLSGLSVANVLVKDGKKILLVDPLASELAPGAPAGLANPATGRRARPGWRSEECYRALRNHLEKLTEETGINHLYSDSGVLRPAITEELAENFSRSLLKYDWPEGWVTWMDEKEVSEFNPDVAPTHGALFVKCGMTVFAGRYLKAYRTHLSNLGADVINEPVQYSHKPGSQDFILRFNNGKTATAEHVIIAAGANTQDFTEWKNLPLHRVKGQLVQFEADRNPGWEHALSAGGYILRSGGRNLIAGSTYEHRFDHVDVTPEAYLEISRKFERILPGLYRASKKTGQLAGVRVTTPDKLPVIGRHREVENLCIYTGLGSKGLLFSEYAGSLLGEHLLEGSKIPDELDINRFYE